MRPLSNAVAFLLVLALVSPAWGANYYASTTGGDSDSGTVTDPFSIYAACAGNGIVTLASGDTVFLRGGLYDAIWNFGSYPYQYMMQPQTNNITYKSYPGEWAILRGDDDWSGVGSVLISIFDVVAADSTTIDSIEFRWGAKGAVCCLGTARNIAIRNCVFDSTPVPGHSADNEATIWSNHGDDHWYDWLIEDNTFRNTNGTGCIHSYGMSGTTIRRNYFTNNSNGGAASIFLKGGNATNRDDEWYDNEFYGPMSGAMAIHCNLPLKNVRLHHNLVWGPGLTATGTDALIHFTYSGCIVDPMDADSIFFYNNTVDFTNYTGTRGLLNGKGDDGVNEFMDNLFVFNNVLVRPPNTKGFLLVNAIDGGSGFAQFGDYLYFDHNLWVQRTAGADIFSYRQSGGSEVDYTMAEWRTQAPIYNSTWVGEDNGDTAADTTSMFIDKGNGDYRLNSSGYKYAFLSTGGRGGSWDTYIGAFAPSDTTCPLVTLVGPGDDTTLGNTSVDIEANFTTDGAGDDIIVTLYGEYSDATPDVLLFTDTLTADSAGWTYNWSSLVEDSTYYWQVIATDTSCADTSAIRSFLVDSIPPPTAVVPSIGAGTNFQGIWK